MELVLQENPAKTLHRCQLKMFQHLHAHRHFRRCESACAQLAAAAILLLALLRLEECRNHALQAQHAQLTKRLSGGLTDSQWS